MNELRTYYQYSTTEIPGLEHLVGRAIVSFQKNFRASYLRGDKFGNKLFVLELRADRLSVGDFPGYNNVLLSHRLLRTVVREQLPSWRSALAAVSGVYLVMDTSTGRPYVGSARGGLGIWQRWEAYATNGHGGNKELKVLLAENGNEHARNFQYTILEVADLNAGTDDIFRRETYWKNVLLSREFGLNSN